jgi:predicted  nucleic acid-binding Zn-ribbon protein
MEETRDAERIELKAATEKLLEERGEAERALRDKESELTKVIGELEKRSTFADAQKTEIIRLKAQVEALEDGLNRANNDLLAMEETRHAERVELKATTEKLLQEFDEAQRALCDRESELTKLMGELDERSNLADAQKIEIIRLETQVEALKGVLDQANNELQAMEETRDAERIELKATTDNLLQEFGEAERALRDKESELIKLMGELDERSNLADVQKSEIIRLESQVEALKGVLDQANNELQAMEETHDAERIELKATTEKLLQELGEAERALWDKESELTKLMGELDERSNLADTQKSEIIRLETQVEALEDVLDRANNDLQAMEETRDAERIELKATTEKLLKELGEAERALWHKESKLTKLMGELDERSNLADAQKVEIIRLETQIAALQDERDRANNELQAMVKIRNAERIELEAATKTLLGERGKFENFQFRVAELVKQVVAQMTDDKSHVQDLENRLVEQSRLLNESESELKHLRGEIVIARKAESDLLNAAMEIEARANNATQNLMAQTAKLQAALDRANGERMRLAHELDKFKRQAEETWAA